MHPCQGNVRDVLNMERPNSTLFPKVDVMRFLLRKTTTSVKLR